MSTITLRGSDGETLTCTMAVCNIGDLKVGDGVLATFPALKTGLYARVVKFGGRLDIKHKALIRFVAREVK